MYYERLREKLIGIYSGKYGDTCSESTIYRQSNLVIETYSILLFPHFRSLLPQQSQLPVITGFGGCVAWREQIRRTLFYAIKSKSNNDLMEYFPYLS